MKRKVVRSKITRAVKDTLSSNHRAGFRIEKNTELLIFLDYIKFVQRLAEKVNSEVTEDKQSVVLPQHVRKVRRNTLKSARL